ncbi:MAG TPA: hypothetical protein DGF36_08760 [Alteromonas sp.]|nr:hypothetical protein [Alteromonas sp.]
MSVAAIISNTVIALFILSLLFVAAGSGIAMIPGHYHKPLLPLIATKSAISCLILLFRQLGKGLIGIVNC